MSIEGPEYGPNHPPGAAQGKERSPAHEEKPKSSEAEADRMSRAINALAEWARQREKDKPPQKKGRPPRKGKGSSAPPAEKPERGPEGEKKTEKQKRKEQIEREAQEKRRMLDHDVKVSEESLTSLMEQTNQNWNGLRSQLEAISRGTPVDLEDTEAKWLQEKAALTWLGNNAPKKDSRRSYRETLQRRTAEWEELLAKVREAQSRQRNEPPEQIARARAAAEEAVSHLERMRAAVKKDLEEIDHWTFEQMTPEAIHAMLNKIEEWENNWEDAKKKYLQFRELAYPSREVRYFWPEAGELPPSARAQDKELLQRMQSEFAASDWLRGKGSLQVLLDMRTNRREILRQLAEGRNALSDCIQKWMGDAFDVRVRLIIINFLQTMPSYHFRVVVRKKDAQGTGSRMQEREFIFAELSEDRNVLKTSRRSQFVEQGRAITPQNITQIVDSHMQSISRAPLEAARTFGIPEGVVRLAAWGSFRKSDLYHDMVRGWQNWPRALTTAQRLIAKINARLPQDKQMNFGEYDFTARDTMLRILSLTNAPNAERILDAITDEPPFNLGFSARARTVLDLKEDLSAILMVNDEMMRRAGRGTRNTGTGATKEDIRTIWTEIRNRQWQSFAQSEEMTPDPSRPNALRAKPVDVLIVQIKEFASTAQVAGQLIKRNLNPPENEGNIHSITLDDCAGFHDFIQQYTRILNAQPADRHLAIYFIAHGSSPYAGAGVVTFPFRTGMEFHRMEEFLRYINPQRTSIFLQPCYGGAQLRLLSEEPRGKSSIRSTWAAATDMVNHLGSSFATMLELAFRKENDGFAAGDINRDGRVSLGEIRYFADTQNIYQDSIGFDTEGRQIVRNDRRGIVLEEESLT